MSIQTDDFGVPPPRVVSAAPTSHTEEAIERALRPKELTEYVGQTKAREQLEIFIGAAKQRGEALDHVLLFGPPGLGKTTLSHIIANELGVNLRQTSGPVLEKPKDLAALLTNLEANDVLFIDEIHRLSPVVEEILYPALEDYQIDIMIGDGPAARSIKLDLQPFTLVGATTRAGMLTNPLRDRFGIVARLEFYTPEELVRIVTRSAGLLNVPIEPEGAALQAGQPVTHPAHPIQGGGYSIKDLQFLIDTPVDGYIQISGQTARQITRDLAAKEGIFGGFSGGANVAAALQLLQNGMRGKTIAAVICDSGLKYLSTDLWT